MSGWPNSRISSIEFSDFSSSGRFPSACSLGPHAGGTHSPYAFRMNPKRQDVTFLVRMWLPEGTDGEARWRGSVLEVASGRRFFVTQPHDVADFISTSLAEIQTRKA